MNLIPYSQNKYQRILIFSGPADYLQEGIREHPPARNLVHGANKDGGRAVQLLHDVEVPRQPVEALEAQHLVRVLH